ncbi:MAG: AMP-binding protein, partial [Solirubrobacteraceae bacterium]
MEEIGVRCGERFSAYPQLFGNALRATRGLHELGVGAGDRVALLLRNSLEFLEASIATVPLGASAVPINWHWRGDEIAHVLTDSGAKVLVAHSDLLAAIASSVPAGVAVVLVDSISIDGGWGTSGEAAGAGGAGTPSWSQWMRTLEPWGEAPERAPMSIIYTSGTTGKPKGVVRTPSSDEQRETMRAALAEIFQLAEGERTVIPAPIYHSAPNVYALACALLGMDMTIMERFDAEEFLRIVQERRVTVVQMVPTMFSRLLSLPQQVRDSYDVSSLRWVVHAAAPCPPEVKRAMIDWLGPIVAEYYGSTETGPVVSCTSEEWLAHPGTVGRAIGDARVKVFDQQGRELGPGESGEVYVWLDLFPDFTYANDEEKRR